MSIRKEKRQQVYNKYNGHCSYCGKRIEYKDMQVDHFIPQKLDPLVVAGNLPGLNSVDDIQNLMPSCRTCNHYKRAHDLETFRRYIEEIPKKLRTNYIYKIGDDGWPTDRYMIIEEGEVYEVNEDWHRIAGGYDTIRLENSNSWIELTQKSIDTYFDLLEE